MVTGELADSPAAGPAAAGRLREHARVEQGPRSAAVIVAALTVAGLAVRLVVAHQSVFGDELSTYWIVATHSLGGVLSLLYGTAKIHHAEISPPLTFLASWVAVQFGHGPELLRAPALVAGALTIPAVYLLGIRTVGRAAALLAAALAALSPFMIYYSTEARAYGVMMLMVVASTLAMLVALDTGRARWWVAYAAASCAGLYAHYTCAFVLAAQLVWLFWAQPGARRAAVIANAAVVLGLIPWLPGLIDDLHSPTITILSDLSPFTPHAVLVDLAHWTVGYPYSSLASLRQLPGTLPLLVLALGTGVALVGLALRVRHGRPAGASGLGPGRGRLGSANGRRGRISGLDRRIALLVALALATPVAEALISAVSTHIFGVRNLAASWPALALCFAAVVVAARGRVMIAATTLVLIAFGVAAVRMLNGRDQRPDYRSAADFIDRTARPGDVVIDETGVLSPGPLTGLDVVLRRHLAVVRALAPAERDHPFGLRDPYVPLSAAVRQAVALAHGARIFVVGGDGSDIALGHPAAAAQRQSSYRRQELHDYSRVLVARYDRQAARG